MSLDAPRPIVCKNCGASLCGLYCSNCGQKDTVWPQSVFEFVGEIIEAFTHADSRLWRTLVLLLFVPGALPKQYQRGRRARYLPPLRLYLLISLSFFIVLSMSRVDAPIVTYESSASASNEVGDPASSGLEHLSGAAQDPGDCEVSYTGPLSTYLTAKFEQACVQLQLDQGKALTESFFANLPTGMFLLMPLFAATMLLFYWRPKRYFIEHLTLQISTHSALFFFATLIEIVQWVSPQSSHAALDGVMALYAGVYCYRSLLVYYAQSAWLTLAKFLVLLIAYLQWLLIVFVFTGLAAII